jgi:predicted Zn-dependent protease
MLSTLRASLRRPRTPLSSAKVLTAVALIAVLCSCQKSGHEHLEDARSSLASGSYDEAIAAAQSGLQSSPSKADTWGLELVKLEAYARGGSGDDAKQQLVVLASAYPSQLSATDYSSTAQQLQEAEQGPAAIEVLDLGKKRHPDDALIERMIADSVSAQSSPEELEMLRSLGYIE